MYQAYNSALRVISTVVLSFFIWTFGGVFDIAYAVKESGQKAESRSQKGNITPPDLPLPQVEGKRPEEKFSKAIEDIDDILKDDKSDHETKKQRIYSKKAAIDADDIEIKKQFRETETKIKDLPEVIKQRHRDFVKKYDENLKELRSNLDSIGKAKNKTETDSAIGKAKAHLEKVRPPKRHQKLDPNKLPHRAEEPVFKEPRTKPEEFEKDNGQQSAMRGQTGKFADGFVGKVSFPLVGNPSESRKLSGRSSRSDKGGKPILVAANGSLDGLLSANTQYITKTSGSLPDGSYQIALANPPSTADLAETIEVQFTPEITAKAEELQHNPVKIYNWVRNNIEFVPTYGSIQGASMCLQTKLCNSFDTSSLLIALLRVSGIHAKYAYGTVEIPAEKVKNWVGGFTDSMSALNLLASAGIPTAGQVVGGEIKYVRIEHTWVEAYVDYIPSRGAKHKVGDTWIPLDASFKQYNYTQGMDIQSAVPFDAQSFINQIQSTATINETEGYVTGVNSSFINQTMTDYQTQVQNYITQTYPNATVGDVLGKKEVIKQEFPHLLGTLPYKTIVKGAKYTSIPDSLRHKITFNVTKDIYDSELGTPLNITKSLPEIAGKKITLSYSPATPADEAVINKYLPKPHADGTPIDPSELPTLLPAYLINVKPELRVDGQVIATGSTIGLGINETFTMSFSGPGANASDVITNDITSGQYLGIGLDLGRISQEQMTVLKTKLEATKAKLEAQNFDGMTKDDILGDLLYTTALSYHAEIGVMKLVSARTMGVVAITYPSETIFASELKVQTFFGLPFSVSAGGLSMDADRLISLVKALDGDKNKQLQFMLASGMNSSILEHSVPEQLFSTPDNPAHGISAVKALRLANDQGIPIYTINQTNIATILPQLQLDSGTIGDIHSAVNAGKIVTVSKTDISFNGWTGCGYIIIDPNTGAGGYMVSGGMNGAYLALLWFSTAILSLALILSLPETLTGLLLLFIVNILVAFLQAFGTWAINCSLNNACEVTDELVTAALLSVGINFMFGSTAMFWELGSFLWIAFNMLAAESDWYFFFGSDLLFPYIDEYFK